MNPITKPLSVKLINKLSLIRGCVIGAITTILYSLLYILNPTIQYTNFIISISTFCVIVTLLTILGIDIRKKLGGYWNYKNAFLSLIIMTVIFTSIGVLMNVILFKIIDPSLPSKINDALTDVTSQRLEKLGMDQSQIDDALKPFSNGQVIDKLTPTFINELESLGLAVITYGIVSLIVAAFITKKPPFEQFQDS